MPRLAELWDAKKYSEGDPIRQLIAASQAYRDWPSDALSWGADLVDMGTGALSKLSSGERRNQIKTDLGGNLRRALSAPRGELGMSEGPAPDVEAGRSVGRMLNPALLMQGDIPGSRALANFQLRKRLADAIPVNKARRAFFAGKEEAMAKPSNEAVVDAVSPIAEAGQEIANAPVDRRSFLKGSAALGGAAAVGGGLLGKFGRVGEAVERAPEATRAGKAASEVSKYKYNSLSEYLDDVQRHADDMAYESGSARAAETEGYNSMDYDRLSERFAEEDIAKHFKRRLLDDEAIYKEAKAADMDSLIKQQKFPDYEEYQRSLNSFSPQAKKEMKVYKQNVEDYVRGNTMYDPHNNAPESWYKQWWTDTDEFNHLMP